MTGAEHTPLALLPSNGFKGISLRILDFVQGLILLSLTLGTTWAFAGNVPPTVKVLNFVGIAGGALCFIRWLVEKNRNHARGRDGMVALILGLLVWCQIAAMNSTRFSFLPTSVDSTATWEALLRLAGLSGGFLSLWDWLLGPMERGLPAMTRQRGRLALRIIVLNSVFLGFVGFIHRLSGDTRLLWIYQPEITGLFYSFGVFDYRGNASQFFNLVWPAAVALWWLRWRRNGFWSAKTLALLFASCWLAACPTLTSSRAGMLFSLVGVVGIALLIPFSTGAFNRRILMATGVTLGVIIGVAGFLGGPVMVWRWKHSVAPGSKWGGMDGRFRQNENSIRMFKAHPFTGSGPGAYSQAHRAMRLPNPFGMARKPDPKEIHTLETMGVMAHDDWLQTLAEWGVPAALAIFWLFLKVLGPRHPRDFVQAALRLGLLLTLLHATMDYPLQVWAVQWVFLSALLLQRVEWLAPDPAAK